MRRKRRFYVGRKNGEAVNKRGKYCYFTTKEKAAIWIKKQMESEELFFIRELVNGENH